MADIGPTDMLCMPTQEFGCILNKSKVVWLLQSAVASKACVLQILQVTEARRLGELGCMFKHR